MVGVFWFLRRPLLQVSIVPLLQSSVVVVSALNRQLSSETIFPKVWSLSAETYPEMSGETLLTLTFLSLRLSMVLKVENLSKETQT